MVNGLHLYNVFIQSTLQFMPLIHPFTYTFTHQRRLAALQGTNQLVRSNWGLGVLLRDTSTRQVALLLRSRHSKSAEFLNVLNDQVIPSMIFSSLMAWGIFQDDNAKIHQALVVKEWSMRTHECQGAWGVIFTHELATTESWLYPIKSIWGVLEKTEGMVWLSCHQYKISVKNECNSGWK